MAKHSSLSSSEFMSQIRGYRLGNIAYSLHWNNGSGRLTLPKDAQKLLPVNKDSYLFCTATMNRDLKIVVSFIELCDGVVVDMTKGRIVKVHYQNQTAMISVPKKIMKQWDIDFTMRFRFEIISSVSPIEFTYTLLTPEEEMELWEKARRVHDNSKAEAAIAKAMEPKKKKNTEEKE